jgi:tellurite resistance protein
MLDPLAEYEKARHAIEEAVSRVMIAMMISDGDIADTEKVAVNEIFEEITGSELDDERYQLEKETVEAEGFSLIEYLQSIAPELNAEGKDKIMRGAFLVAAADGVFHEQEKLALQEIGQALDIEDREVDHLLAIMNDKKPTAE